MARKVVQIAACESRGILFVYALCDDGTVWENSTQPGIEWTRIEDIPQDAPEVAVALEQGSVVAMAGGGSSGKAPAVPASDG